MNSSEPTLKSANHQANRKAIISTLSIGALCAIGAFAATFLTSSFIFKDTKANAFFANATESGIHPFAHTTSTPVFKETLSIQFFGDMMFDRGVRANINQKGADFVFASGTKALTKNFDLTIANLEGPVSTFASRTINSAGKGIPGFSFTFPTSTAQTLKESGIDIVSLANNHTENFGAAGLKQTVEWLRKANVAFFGNPTNALNSINAINPAGENASSTTSTSPMTLVHCISDQLAKEKCIALIGYHEFTFKNEALIIAQIKAARSNPKVNYIFVMPHWGEEYKFEPNQKQKNLAHQWIDAGADMVVGAHPHVIQSLEQYKGKYIFYSLGNYIFDQYFSYETTHGMTIGLEFDLSDDLKNLSQSGQNINLSTSTSTQPQLILKKISLVPVDITNTNVRKANEIDTNKILLKLAEVSKKYVPVIVHDAILRGEIEN